MNSFKFVQLPKINGATKAMIRVCHDLFAEHMGFFIKFYKEQTFLLFFCCRLLIYFAYSAFGFVFFFQRLSRPALSLSEANEIKYIKNNK